MPKAHPAAISNYLTRAGLPRATGPWGGYRIERTDQPNRATIHWVIGGIGGIGVGADQESPGIGWGGMYLRVQEIPDDGLTPLMRTAYDQIREGGENYRYRPITPSLNQPTPVTPKDLAPIVSGGLLWRTVAALERRGLVRLVPLTPLYGQVLAVPQEDTDA
jgi:hypothetical protein